jgi:hypothetical protein
MAPSFSQEMAGHPLDEMTSDGGRATTVSGRGGKGKVRTGVRKGTVSVAKIASLRVGGRGRKRAVSIDRNAQPR